jgi:type I site-specific restriction-modification system R (restriction) subunit
MQDLNLPKFNFQIRKNAGGKLEIFDSIRRKYIVLTPEEWVRQNFVKYLVDYKNFPASLMSVEKALKVNNLTKRTDIVQYNKEGVPIVIVECKAPHIRINEDTFAQTAMYNLKMQVDYLIMTNGLTHYVCKVDYTNHQLEYLKDIPIFTEL